MKTLLQSFLPFTRILAVVEDRIDDHVCTRFFVDDGVGKATNDSPATVLVNRLIDFWIAANFLQASTAVRNSRPKPIFLLSY